MSDEPEYFIGIDGGGTHTRAMLVDGEGRRLGLGMAGPSNYQAVGIESTRTNILRSVNDAWEQAGIPMRPAAAAFLGVAGVASETDRTIITGIAQDIGLAEKIGADHDIRTALAGGLAGKEGIALIAGTGSACYGRRHDGRAWRAGGWGHLLDDAGSGYWMGVQGLAAITRAHDGRSGPTALTPLLVTALGITDMDDMLRLAGDDGLSRTDIAGLAPIVLDAARNGDATALAILEHGAGELGGMVRSVATVLGWQNQQVHIVLVGGLVANNFYVEMIRSAITDMSPGVIITEPLLPPVAGAALLALELAGRHPAPAVISTLQN